MNVSPTPGRLGAADTAIASLTSELSGRFGDRVATSAAVREQHGHSLTWAKNQPPDIVVYPRTTEEVSEIVRLCAAPRWLRVFCRLPLAPSGPRWQ